MVRPYKGATRHIWVRLSMALMALVVGHAVSADDYAASWGPAVGAQLPVLQALDQSGTPRNLDNLAGEQGLLMFLSRSADW